MVLVGGTNTMDCLVAEVCLTLVTTPLTDDITHVGCCPPTLEGPDTTGTEGFHLAIEHIGGLETDLEFETAGAGLEVRPGY